MKKLKKINTFKSLLTICIISLKLDRLAQYRKELSNIYYIIEHRYQQHYKDSILNMYYIFQINKQHKYIHKKIHNILNYSTHKNHNLRNVFSLITLKYVEKYRYLYHKYCIHASPKYKLRYAHVISKAALIQIYILYRLLNTRNKFFIYKIFL